jgi:hypothetical protein
MVVVPFVSYPTQPLLFNTTAHKNVPLVVNNWSEQGDWAGVAVLNEDNARPLEAARKSCDNSGRPLALLSISSTQYGDEAGLVTELLTTRIWVFAGATFDQPTGALPAVLPRSKLSDINHCACAAFAAANNHATATLFILLR